MSYGCPGKSKAFCWTKHACQPFYFVIPAKAGTQVAPKPAASNNVGTWTIPGERRAGIAAGDQAWDRLGPRLRGDDEAVGVTGQLTASSRQLPGTPVHLRGDDEVVGVTRQLTADNAPLFLSGGAA